MSDRSGSTTPVALNNNDDDDDANNYQEEEMAATAAATAAAPGDSRSGAISNNSNSNQQSTSSLQKQSQSQSQSHSLNNLYANLSTSGQEAMRRMAKIVNNFLARADSTPFREPVDWRGLELYDYPEIIRHPMDLGRIKRKLDRGKYDNAASAAYDMRLVWKNCMRYNAVGSDFWLLAKGYSRRFEDRYRRIRNDYDVGVEPVDSEEERAEGDSSADDEDDENNGDDDDDDDDEEMDYEYEDAVNIRSIASSTGTSGGGRGSTPPPPKLDHRAKLASNLLLLNGIHLGEVIALLEDKCPQALVGWNDTNTKTTTTKQQLQESVPPLPDKLEIVLDNIQPDAVFHQVAKFVHDRAAKHHKREPTTPVKIVDVSNRRKR